MMIIAFAIDFLSRCFSRSSADFLRFDFVMMPMIFACFREFDAMPFDDFAI